MAIPPTQGPTPSKMSAEQICTSTSNRPSIAFISGPMDPDGAYFATHYRAAVDRAIQNKHHFVIGSVEGIDTLALTYLLQQGLEPSRITIYLANFEAAIPTLFSRLAALGVRTRVVGESGEAVSTGDRDAAMTRESDYDILRYRTEEEAKELYAERWWPRVSNTEMNERRRRGVVSEAYVLKVGTERMGKEVGESRRAGEKKSFMSTLKSMFGKVKADEAQLQVLANAARK